MKSTNPKCLITVFIPTYNEEKNIENAISSIANFVDQIVIVDSNSTDSTISIAKRCFPGIDVINIPFITFSDKFNKAMKSNIIRNNWIMRLDADEVVIDAASFFNALSDRIVENKMNTVGFYVARRYYFLNSWIKYGGVYPKRALRVWRKGDAFFEDRQLDEKVILSGDSDILDIEIADKNQMSLLGWVKKHIWYAKLESVQASKMKKSTNHYDLEDDRTIHENKMRYYSFPVFLRPLLYFLQRMIVQKGILDGPKGWLYHFLHAFCYREVVDFYIVKRKIWGFFKKSL